MKYEIEAATQFLTTLLFPPEPSNLPHSQSTPSLHLSSTSAASPITSTSSTVLNKATAEENEKMAKLFSKILSKTLAKKFVNHWYEEEPIKGQAYRSILVDCENNFIDKVILTSARKANIKNIEGILKNTQMNGFLMWIDPGEVEVEFFAISTTSSRSSSYKSAIKSNEILYSIHRSTKPQLVRSTRAPSPPPSSSSPPSSPASSSYYPLSTDNPKMPLFARQIKPIRISVRQNEEIYDKKMEENVQDDHDHHLHRNMNNNEFDPVKSFAIPQPAM